MGAGTGAGIFKTGTGTVSLNGDTAITTTGAFTTGSGTVSLAGHTTVAVCVIYGSLFQASCASEDVGRVLSILIVCLGIYLHAQISCV